MQGMSMYQNQRPTSFLPGLPPFLQAPTGVYGVNPQLTLSPPLMDPSWAQEYFPPENILNHQLERTRSSRPSGDAAALDESLLTNPPNEPFHLALLDNTTDSRLPVLPESSELSNEALLRFARFRSSVCFALNVHILSSIAAKKTPGR